MAARKRWSLSVPQDGFTLAEHAALARDAEQWGYADAWSFESDGLDCFAPLAVIGMATNLRLGTAIANVYTRGPATLAQCAAGVADVAPGRFILGIGSGSQVIIEKWNGGRFDKPATRVREMALFLREALTGERVVFKGKTFEVDGFRLTKPPSKPVPIYVAALRPGMLRVAGEVADGVILNWLAPEDVPKSVKVVREAAEKAGRDPASIEITARIFVNLDPVTPESELAVRRHVAGYLNVPVYRRFQEWLGRTEALAGMWRAWEAGDRKAAVAAIPQGLLDDLFTRGPLPEIRRRLIRYFDAGLETAFLALSTTEGDPARRQAVVREALRVIAS
jgi:probable F420-dependent oxidoreductase